MEVRGEEYTREREHFIPTMGLIIPQVGLIDLKYPF